MEIAQYEIVLVNMDPKVGSEIKKTRPCVIISPDVINSNLRTIVIAPMTTKSKKYPTRVEIKKDDAISCIAIDQIRTIDKSRIIKILGKIGKDKINEIKSVMKETYVD
jgi:mRNA interferase MazF